MSRNLTYSDDSSSETPTEKANSSNIIGIINSQLRDGITPLHKANMVNTTKPKNRLIRADSWLETTSKYLGRFIFLIKSPLETTAVKPMVVDSTKKLQRIIPVNK